MFEKHLLKKSLIAVLTVGMLGSSLALAQPEAAPEAEPYLKENDRNNKVLYPESPVTLQEVLDSKLMTLDADGQFHPERLLSRADLATVLVKTFEISEREPETTGSPLLLKDVAPGHWAYAAITEVVSKGVMTGYREGRFYPDQKVNRAEGFAIFAQAFGIYPFKEDVINDILGRYRDQKEVPGWARKAVATAAAEGFINTQNDQLRPMAPMTRGDMAYALSWWLARKKRYSPAKGL